VDGSADTSVGGVRVDRTWWVDVLGARRDPRATWRWTRDATSPTGERSRHLEVTSYGTSLRCVLIEPPGGSRQVVVLPFYEVESLLGQPSPRRPPTSRESERRGRAFGTHLLRRGVAVLAVPWWCEVEARADGSREAGLEGRYGPPAAAHLARVSRVGPTGYGRAIGDLSTAVDALVAAEPARVLTTFGHSLGGKLALGLAALDERIQAAALHEPGLGFAHSNWDAPWYLGDRVPTDRDLDGLLASIAPRPVLYVGGGLLPGSDSDASDGPSNVHLAESARRRAGSDRWLRVLHHDAGHTPPPHVLEACYTWLLDHGGATR
ncbi:MAG TPA: hypothetical protein VI076_03015, partial [Actinopolymorphaceae bacterium]